MILVDTSAWVEYDRATTSPVDERLAQLIAESDDIAVTEPIIMEVIAGARDEQRAGDLGRLLDRFRLLRFDPAIDFEGAASIYRTCRRSGITPRGMVGCMISSVALRHGATLLARDADLRRVAGVFDITIDPASLAT
jgi:predicted nucleic acid-binding protein